ncbi:MAG: hypothetical protein ACM34I_01725, partial [bacterium]
MELEPKELNREAKNIINQLAIVLRSAQFHSPDNVAVLSAIEKFVALVNPFIASEGIITIDLVGEYFHVNDTRVRYSVEFLLNFDFLVRAFRDRELGSIEFKNALKPVDTQKLIKAFIGAGNAEDKFEEMANMLRETENIVVSRLKKVSEEGDGDIRKV